MRRRPILALCVVAVSMAGCPASLDDPSRFFGTSEGGGDVCSDVPDNLFIPTCAASGCHNPTDLAQGLDLESPGVATRLVGVRATGGAGMLVDPTQPEQSVLYTKLTFDPPYGARMPFGKDPLDDATIRCVLSWIQTKVPESGVAPMLDATSAPDDGSSDDGASDDAMMPTLPEAGPPFADGGPPDAGRIVDAGRRDAASGARDAGVADAAGSSQDATVADASPKDSGGVPDDG